MRGSNGGGSRAANSAVETVNAAATAIASAESRVPQATVQVQISLVLLLVLLNLRFLNFFFCYSFLFLLIFDCLRVKNSDRNFRPFWSNFCNLNESEICWICSFICSCFVI